MSGSNAAEVIESIKTELEQIKKESSPPGGSRQPSCPGGRSGKNGVGRIPARSEAADGFVRVAQQPRPKEQTMNAKRLVPTLLAALATFTVQNMEAWHRHESRSGQSECANVGDLYHRR